ncbi:hypothetical protein PAHAL_7G156900 [Panicum hallii]|jgi:hypothetical protein|uniref:Uncharacterized protein n=1 Tax=Panicum hallii TaxID=206008 RepID=A0A2T8ICD4_9POAL|nr:hypothetical protein PAHAL_7G156900 [Panicum hallii]
MVHMETTKHLCLHWTDGLISVPMTGMEIEDWWNLSLQAASAENRSRVAAVLI